MRPRPLTQHLAGYHLFHTFLPDMTRHDSHAYIATVILHLEPGIWVSQSPTHISAEQCQWLLMNDSSSGHGCTAELAMDITIHGDQACSIVRTHSAMLAPFLIASCSALYSLSYFLSRLHASYTAILCT